MFARYFIELPLPSTVVEDLLSRHGVAALDAAVRSATRRGDRLLADVGVGDRHRIERTVEIRLGPEIHAATKTVVPMSWRPVGAAGGLFPTLDADLEIAPLDEATTQLAISARYAPPLGPVGRLLDRAVLHRVAETTIKDFLDQVGDAIRALASANGSATLTPA